MIIGGIQPCSFSDYPSKTAAVIFTQGCNFRCPFCHNGSLLSRDKTGIISEQACFDFLEKRMEHLDGVVISGGEPTIHTDLLDFTLQIRSLGYLVKLDTNGSKPLMLKQLLDKQSLDYIAMDIKAPLEKYAQLCGLPVNTENINTSMEIIATSGIAHHFRTTEVNHLLNAKDLCKINDLVPTGSAYVVQPFVAENAATIQTENCFEQQL